MSEEWEVARRHILWRAKYKCEKCGEGSQRLHVHHIKPRSEGGGHELDNLEVRCPDCHADAHDAEACILCGRIIHEGGDASLIDTSGATIIQVCDDCREVITRMGEDSEKCSICGRVRHPDRSEGICWARKGAPSPIYKVCDECRRRILPKNRSEIEEYIDEELPDGEPNFKHWEGGGRT